LRHLSSGINTPLIEFLGGDQNFQLNFVDWGLMILALTLYLWAEDIYENRKRKAIPKKMAADYENALPVEMQLAMGTMMLDGTENEVDPATAEQLVTLWKAARSLSESDSAAQAEIDALYKQIEETMSPARIQAISDMQITRQDMTQVFQARIR
jgi:hypothetical protein